MILVPAILRDTQGLFGNNGDILVQNVPYNELTKTMQDKVISFDDVSYILAEMYTPPSVDAPAVYNAVETFRAN